MIDLHFSNRSEGLLRALALDIAHSRFEPERAWEPVHVVFPNPSVRQFVLRRLAEPFQVLANVRTSHLEAFWRQFLPPDLRLLDRRTLQGILLALLADAEVLRQPELAPVRSYLEGPAKGLKTLQLAAELARLFEAYQLGRPEWATAWARGAAAVPDEPATEAWQRALWNRLRERLARSRESSGETWMTLAELVQDARFRELDFPGEVFVFGLGHMAQAHLEAFRKLAGLATVHLYALSPCREAWDTFRDDLDRGRSGGDPFGLENRGGLALRRWGRPVREQVRLLCEAAGWHPQEAFEAPADDSLLAALQREILQAGEAASGLGGRVPDGSLAVHACPSPRREAEVVANLVWDRVLAGGARFSDIAVAVPESLKAEYVDHLRLAFAGTRELPWALADESPALLKQVAEAARLLLGLGLTDLNRAEVLRVATHPVFRRVWSGCALDELAPLCERCAIIARLDREQTAGTSMEGGLWTWERGLQRAALGRFAGADGVLPEPGGALPGAVVAPEHLDLLHLMTALLRDARRLAGLVQSPRAWADTLERFLWAYLSPGGDEGLVRALEAVGRSMGRMRALEVPGVPAPALGLREVAALLDEEFAQLLSENLGQLGGGVVVASLASLRGIPFDTLILMGLGEGLFPGRDVPSALDLRAGQRRAGDLSRGDLDRTLFLEAVLSARERLACTYVARDPVSGAELEPSPLLLDLRDLLLPALGTAGWAALGHRHPIHRHDLAYFPELGGTGDLPASHHPEARLEAEALWLGRDLRGQATELPLDLRTWGLPEAARQALEARTRFPGSLQVPAAAPEGGELRLRVSDLRKWLEDPLQGGARIRLRLRGEDGDDPALVAEEPFETPFLRRRALMREVFWRLVQDADFQGGPAGDEAVRKAVGEALHAAREAGFAPVGVLRDAELEGLCATVSGWLGLLPDPGEVVAVRFGPDRGGGPGPCPEEGEAPVALAGLPGTLLLEGRTEPLVAGESILLSEHEPPKPGKPPEARERRELLRIWLDQLLLAASGRKAGAHSVRILAAGGAWRVRLPGVTPDAAREQLARWAGEALRDRRWGSMPLEGVLACLEAGDGEPEALAEWIEGLDGPWGASCSALYGPLPRLVAERLEPDWAALAGERLGAFLDWSRVWEDAR